MTTPRRWLRRIPLQHVLAIVGFATISVLFVWPLPLHLLDGLPGPPGGDLGVYVWNLWLFRHEIVAHHSLPFATREVLALTAPVPLTLHNYTAFANILAFPLLPLLGPVGSYNVLVITNSTIAAYAMFLFAKVRTSSGLAAWAAGLLFGFSPYMSARTIEHFSLAQAAPLPIFGLLIFHLAQRQRLRTAAAAGVVVAWAFLCDPYYAVYCLLILLFTVGYSVVSVTFLVHRDRSRWWTRVLDLVIFCMAGLIVGVVIDGGWRFDLLGARVSIVTLYTPVLLLLCVAGLRVLVRIRPTLSWNTLPVRRPIATSLVAGAACALVLAPVLYAMTLPHGNPLTAGPATLWRHSAPGVDLATWFIPNPSHPWFRATFAPWVASQPNGYVENVASMPWVALLTIAGAATFARYRVHRGWLAFTAVFAWMSLGPFIRVAGVLTYVLTPWALLRYVPVIGAARMPPRLTVLVMLGLAMILAMAVAHLRERGMRRRWVVGLIALLAFELCPAPVRVVPAKVPALYDIIAADTRDVRVLNLPFGLRDGLSSAGNTSALYQYYQTRHRKALVGGYLSRLPPGAVEQYDDVPFLSVLLDLSEGQPVDPASRARAVEWARTNGHGLDIGWVVVHKAGSSPELIDFAHAAFALQPVAGNANATLYRVE